MPLKAQTLTGDLSGQNQFVGYPNADGGVKMGTDDYYSVSVTGSFTGTISLQRSLDGGTTWGNLDQTGTPFEWGGRVSSGCVLRCGFDQSAPAAPGSAGIGFVGGSAHVIFKVGQ